MNKGRLVKTAQRVLAFVLSVTLILGGIPFTTNAANTSVSNKVTDPSTLHSWENWFGEDSTEFAGGVWSDKTVFKTADDFEAALGNTQMNITMNGADNFIVSLSALASNKEIVGYSTIPTDTILILDVSESMDDSSSVPQMVASANAAIDDLLELNNNNRVGVVLYSGNTNAGASGTGTGTLLLELERYDDWNDNGNYIAYDGNSSATEVSTASRLTKEDGGSVTSKSKVTDGGTYIQNGLALAMDEFESVEDKVIPQGNVQAGTKRMPIIVLMSDGAPTTGTQSYTNIQTSTVGNGTSSSAGLGFMTQLTAAYLKEQVEGLYGQTPKFYTLGLNLSGNDSSQYIAQSVLDPSNSLNAISTYWDNLFNANMNSASFYSPGTRRQNNQDIWVTVQRDSNDGLEREDQNYVDKYFAASGNAGLQGAFTDIVNEIIIQSAYYPTEIEGANTDLDGYLTIEDEIGQFMEVKNITGLMLGDNQLFTGAALTKMMGTSEFGDRNTYTELGWELVESVAERIGVSQDVAIELLKNAWADGQLSYTNDTTFSNYIGWYEDADNGYVAYWNDSHTEADIPANAKYITRSYGFYGTVQNGTIEALGSDMMHIVVKVRTEIATLHQDVVWMIPASLIPVVTYHVELDTDSFDTAEDIEMYREDEKPIRLLFEVGLRSDINELNINEVLAEENLVTGQHIHKNSDGTYTFYTNQWGGGEGGTIDYDKPYEHIVTESHFHPNEANERYYYTQDTVIYVNTGTEKNPVYEEYTGTAAPSGSGYYHARRVFTSTSSLTDAAKMDNIYVPIAEDTLTTHVKQDGSNWYIEKGAIYQELKRFQERTLKAENTTGTLDYYAHHNVAPPGEGSAEYDVWAYLGNNGKMTVTPATGIKLTKLVDHTVTDADAVFKFTIELGGGNFDGTYRFVDAAGNYGTITFSDNKSSVIELKAKETIYVIDLPVGATYKVSETDENQEYKVQSVSINGAEVNGVTATGTIQSTILADVEFTNAARGESYEPAPASLSITGTKALEGRSLTLNQFEFVLKEGNTEISRAKNSATGLITFPELTYTQTGTYVYTVTEVNGGSTGYTYDDSTFTVTVEVTDDGLGQLHANIISIVETDGADEENINDTLVVFRNKYVPNPVTVTIDAVKLLENRNLVNREFTFELYETASDFVIQNAAIETAHNAADGKIEFAHAITEAGTYYFVMKEDASHPKADIVYDDTEYQITVVVYDVGGRLSYRTTYAVEGRAVSNIVFSNVFVPRDPVQKEVHLKGTTDINIDGQPVQAGDVLTYEIDYTNLTNVEQDELVITDTIPAGTTYVDGSASEEGFVSHTNGVLTWEFDNISIGEKVVVTFDVKVNEGKATITNQAHVELGTNSWNTNEVTNYTFDKEVDKTEVKIGEEVKYTILYKNTEEEAAEITIVDKLAEGLTYVEGSASHGGIYDKETHTITWILKNVAALTDGEVSFKAIVNEKAVKVIDNVATIRIGSEAAIMVETGTVETKVLASELEITKKQSLNGAEASTAVLQVKDGDKVMYSLTIKNIGNLAATGITLTDKVPAGLKVEESSISNKGVLKDGVITWTIDELKADESITVIFAVTITEDNKNAKFTNIAQTIFENDPTDPDKPQETNEVTVEYVPETAPKTGDNTSIGLWSTLAFSSLMACGVLLILEKKHRREI